MKQKKTPKLKPRAKQIIIVPDDESSRTSEYGILTPSNVEQEQKATGVVEAVGEGIKDLKKGDHVIYGAYAGEKINFSGKSKGFDFVILFDEDVIATIED